MAGVSRNNDTAGGDLIPSQATVFVNGQLVIVSGDGVASHGIGVHGAQTISSGTQSTVSINGIDILVAGDTADVCGEVATGSGTVSIG